MNIARLGALGEEVPVVQHEGISYDLRRLTRDVDGAFLASDGVGRARDAVDCGELPVLAGRPTCG